MSSVTILIGASVVTFLLILLFMQMGKSSKDENGDKTGSNHVLLQVLLLGFILSGLVIIGKASFDDSGKNCGWLVNQSISSGNTTSYDYNYICSTDNTTTGFTFYQLTVWIMRLVGIYIFCYLVYVVLTYFGFVGNNRKGRDD
jgi:heme/copper-type cytochrome/quinol oxidase subunit 2